MALPFGTTDTSLFKKILQALKAPGGPLEPPDAGRENRSGVFQFSPGASWDFGESPLISRKRSRRVSRPLLRCSSEIQLLQDSSSSVGPVKSLPSSPSLRRCVWADIPNSYANGRQSPSPRLEYLEESHHAALKGSEPQPKFKSHQIPGVPSSNVSLSRPADAPKRRPSEVYMHRSCTLELVMRVVEMHGVGTPTFIYYYL